MYRKMNIGIAGLCLIAVFVLVIGCEGPAAKTTCPAAKKPAPPAKALGPYELDTEGFITNWLVVGPFPNPGERPDNEGFDVDYLKKYSGEADHVPGNEMEITKDDGSKVKWAQYQSTYSSRIDFFSVENLQLTSMQDDILAYAACLLECQNDMDVEIRVGSDDGYKLWLDHKLIAQQHVYRAAFQDQESYPVKLSKGKHLILIKVDQDYGSFEFLMRVVTPDGQKAAGIKVWN